MRLTGPWYMKAGALGPPFRATLRRADKQPIDLTPPPDGVVDHVDFVMRQRGSTTPVVEAASTVVQEGTDDVGVAQYDWIAGDTDLSGFYRAEFALYDADGNVLARVPNDSYQEVIILGNLSQITVQQEANAIEVSALPQEVDLAVFVGDDFTLQIAVTEDDGTASDLTNATVEANIYGRTLDDPPIAAFDPLVDLTGTIYLQLTSATSSTLPKHCLWDCAVELNGDTKTLAGGKLTVVSSVVR